MNGTCCFPPSYLQLTPTMVLSHTQHPHMLIPSQNPCSAFPGKARPQLITNPSQFPVCKADSIFLVTYFLVTSSSFPLSPRNWPSRESSHHLPTCITVHALSFAQELCTILPQLQPHEGQEGSPLSPGLWKTCPRETVLLEKTAG